MDARGTVRGNAILLEQEVPALEGKPVQVHLEIIDEAEPQLSPDEQRSAWAMWVERGSQGPLDDQDETWL